MDKLEKTKRSIENRINESRNRQGVAVTIALSTLKDIMKIIIEQQHINEMKEPMKADFVQLPFNDYRFDCPRCKNKVEMFQCGEQTKYCPFCGQNIVF